MGQGAATEDQGEEQIQADQPEEPAPEGRQAEGPREAEQIQPRTEDVTSGKENPLGILDTEEQGSDEAGAGAADILFSADTAPRVADDSAHGTAAPPAHSIFTEDTDYLHDFLTRTKAKKTAKPASPSRCDVARSPMTRSRRALMQLSANSPQLGASPRPKAEAAAPAPSPSPCPSPTRRSTRTRLPQPAAGAAVNPCTIPVRRSNGTEFVFLQRTEAQQIALATKSNTKRNKGEAVAPKIKLQTLAERQASPCKSLRKRAGGKEVSWNDELAFFGAAAAGQSAAKARRKARRLGTVNGTPAPKKTAAVELETVKRRGRTRSATQQL